MTIFAVIATDKNEQKINKLNTLISSKYADNHLKLDDKSWLVFGAESIQPKGIFQDLFGDDTSISCLIVPFDAYWGVQSKAVWDWLKNKGL
ncbi:MAG: hypothetical protein COA59_06070 [Colwellia sp.]|jgi:tRNA(Leu) C34 or U34 (ribose-2'-O)-methylase TrmL|nr:MAG: hypothetical protein COA59_06070 [Colwellia sp.]